MINRKTFIKTIASFSLVLFFSTLCFAQSVTLQESKPPKWVTVVSNGYSIFVTPNDIKQTIALLPAEKQENYATIANLPSGTIVDLDNTSDQEQIILFKTDLITYLLKNGKAYIENKTGAAITALGMEKSPMQKTPNGETKVFIIFSEESKTIIMGSLSF